MKTAHIPKLSHHKASGKAVVRLNGRDVYLGDYGSAASKAEYNRLIGEWMANGCAIPEPKDSNELTVADLIAGFWKHAEDYYRLPDGTPSGETSPLRAALRCLRVHYGHTKASEFGPLALKSLRNAMVKGGWSLNTKDATALAKPWARKTTNRQIGRIRQVFKWGTENELISASVVHGLSAVRPLLRGRCDAIESAPVKPVDDAHIEAIRPYLNATVTAMMDTQLLTGMRPAEVCKMRVTDITMADAVWKYVPSHHKTEHHGHAREVFIGPKGQEALRPFIHNLSGYVFSPIRAEAQRNEDRRENRQTPMTPSQAMRKAKAKPKRAKGERYSVASYRRAIARACDKAGIPAWHPHQLRHSAATRLRAVAGIDAARAVLGHKSTAMTELYAERDGKQSAEIMKLVG